MKKALMAAGLALFAGLVFGADGAAKYFTADELKLYDGQNGNPMYLAVDGVVYDYTGVAPWAGGQHKGGKAGTDISELIKKAPHGKGVLSKRTVVGKLVKAFTSKELASFDGKDGRPMYLAVDGVVYDYTGVAPWSSGQHKGGKAGTDISKLIKKAPHGKGVLSQRTVVGKLVAEPVKK